MAFSIEKNEFARRAAARHAETILFDYLQGREKLYAVEYAVNELKVLFHEGAAQSIELIDRALKCDPDDYDARYALITKAVELLDHQVRSDSADLLRPGRR